MLDILAVQALVNRERLCHGRRPGFQKRENLGFEQVLLLILQLEAGVIDDLDPIIALGIV